MMLNKNIDSIPNNNGSVELLPSVSKIIDFQDIPKSTEPNKQKILYISQPLK